jgi:8-oxo-dGTP pyrophosphatase MutT (NUDIX family)
VTPVPTFVTAAVCIVRDGELLTVRKSGSRRYQLPGGKIDPGETPIEAALREVQEEVGLELPGEAAEPLGQFHDIAANEPGWHVDATVFAADLPEGARPEARAEIAEQRWVRIDADLPDDLAPVLANHILPALRARLTRHD